MLLILFPGLYVTVILCLGWKAFLPPNRKEVTQINKICIKTPIMKKASIEHHNNDFHGVRGLRQAVQATLFPFHFLLLGDLMEEATHIHNSLCRTSHYRFL